MNLSIVHYNKLSLKLYVYDNKKRMIINTSFLISFRVLNSPITITIRYIQFITYTTKALFSMSNRNSYIIAVSFPYLWKIEENSRRKSNDLSCSLREIKSDEHSERCRKMYNHPENFRKRLKGFRKRRSRARAASLPRHARAAGKSERNRTFHDTKSSTSSTTSSRPCARYLASFEGVPWIMKRGQRRSGKDLRSV